ncbi:MAG: hypothetical protein J7L14_02500 [Candidatus Diapherotrites archaeon]|nr:hypothetical protein [Candidatus Diapherotrites archaeon]
MEYKIKDYNLKIMLGYLTIPSKGSLKKILDSQLVLFPAELITSIEQILIGFYNAICAVEENAAIARDFEVEFILRTLATRQISKARGILKESKKPKLFIAVLYGKTNQKIREAENILTGLSFKERKLSAKFFERNLKRNFESIRRFYGISKNAIKNFGSKVEALQKLTIEKIALLNLS